MPHTDDDRADTDRYLLDQPVGWSRVGVAVGAALFGALVMLAVFPDASVSVIDRLGDWLPAIVR